MDDLTATVSTSGLNEQDALERVINFAQRFGSLHADLAAHAAFPLVLTPDLLYRIWASFLPQIPWTTVSDILLSPLCREVGYELYEMDPVVRNILLGELREDNQFGESRLRELAGFLKDYIKLNLNSDEPDQLYLAEAQNLTALAHTAPDEAAREIASRLSDLSQLRGAELIRVANLTEALYRELREFPDLVTYTRGMERLAHGDHKTASDLLKLVFAEKQEIEIAGVTLQRPRVVEEIWQAEEAERLALHTVEERIAKIRAEIERKQILSFDGEFSRYQITHEIGNSYMATVYRAYDPMFERDVALKVLKHGPMDTVELRERFDREVKIIARLEHGSIVPVYDVGFDKGHLFFVMRYMTGGSLFERIQKGLSLKEVVSIIERLAHALDYAHKKGVIHGNLKPANILFDENNYSFISDFGMARSIKVANNITDADIIIGTPRYMSPEQARGDEVDSRSDLYSLGVIIFEMLSGHSPFEASTQVNAATHVIEPLPNILKINPNLPPEMGDFFKNALADNPDDRYTTAINFANAFVAAIPSDRAKDRAKVFDSAKKYSRYEIKAELGQGGMATVYRAYDPLFEREVVLKILKKELLEDPQIRESFERETKIVARLEHAVIVPVYDFGFDNGQMFYVMRYMAGGSLSERIEKGLTPHEIGNILLRLAAALDYAHGRGIVHRDLKPGNILFDENNNPSISDFGIAKFLQTSTKIITHTDMIGTPRYMSPEQARGDEADGRSDLYSLGVILFEMLSGKAPFEATTPSAMAFKHAVEAPLTLLTINPNLPEGVEAVIAKALAKQPDDRYSTCAEFTNAFFEVFPEASSPDIDIITPLPPRPPRAQVTPASSAPSQTRSFINRLFNRNPEKVAIENKEKTGAKVLGSDIKFSRYEIRAELGVGGMSIVYRAYDQLFEREVALKILKKELLEDPQVSERFKRETEIIAKLEHDNIVPLYDSGFDNGQLFYVMRYMAGGSLIKRINNGLTPNEIAHILIRVSAALDYAHSRGIVHRNLKPSAILFDENNNPYISDFIIAKFLQASTKITHTGIIGTPRYMSPEQARGDEADGRSDLYSLGIILFEMLSGKAPFEATTPLAMAFKHAVEAPPSILTINPNLPEGVEAVIAKALAKQPDDRYSTCAEFTKAFLAVFPDASSPDADIITPLPPRLQPKLASSAPSQTRSFINRLFNRNPEKVAIENKEKTGAKVLGSDIKFSRYEIRSEVGYGGIATVYRAYDPMVEREVALKILKKELLEEPQLRERFKREIEIIAKLEHDNIVPLYDSGFDNGQLFYVMRYMAGGSLSERIHAGSLNLEQISYIVLRLADALDYMHSKGIIHRDLKPSNILFDEVSTVYISDFGMAKLVQASTRISDSGIMGTPRYLSPEQARGDQVDGRSDQYSLSIIMFEILSGRVPFEAETPLAMALKHATEAPPSILEINPNLPPALDDIFKKVLQKQPANRYDTCVKFANALLEALPVNALPKTMGETPYLSRPQMADAPTEIPSSRQVEDPSTARSFFNRLFNRNTRKS